MLEGALIWDVDKLNTGTKATEKSSWYMGKPIQEVFQSLYPQQGTESTQFLKAIDDIIKRKRSDEVAEHDLGNFSKPE